CQKNTVHHPLSQSRLEHKKLTSTPADHRECCRRIGSEEEKKNGCGDFGKCVSAQRPEDEAEKTRLSLLEDKLTDSLTFLLQLPNKNVSHMALEKIVMNSLGVCSKPDAAGSTLGLQVADTLCIHLTSSDLPKGTGEEDKEGRQSGEKHLLPPLGCQTNNVNSLLISG
ncbi:hypothetical protein GOODEAATRI_008926, partial [Goodea atripinnis]